MYLVTFLLSRDDELVTFSLLDKPMDLGGAARRTLGQSRMFDDVTGMQDQDASGETDPAPSLSAVVLALRHLAACPRLFFDGFPSLLPVLCADTTRRPLLWGSLRAADADTDDGGVEEEAAEVARIRANALMVSQCGKTLQAGAWRGCAKSAW